MLRNIRVMHICDHNKIFSNTYISYNHKNLNLSIMLMLMLRLRGLQQKLCFKTYVYFKVILSAEKLNEELKFQCNNEIGKKYLIPV